MTDTRLHSPPTARWTRDPDKIDAYTRDSWYLEASGQLVDLAADHATSPGPAGHRMATLLVKPDGIVTGSAGTVVRWLLREGFVVHDAARVPLDANAVRALWLYQWNIATPERRLLADALAALSPSLVLVVGSGPEHPADEPCTVRLTALKGPTDPDHRRPCELRGTLPGGSFLLNLVHTADEPADAVRELGILLDRRRRDRALRRVLTHHDDSEGALDLALSLDSEFGGHRIDVVRAHRHLERHRLRGESDGQMCRRLLTTGGPDDGADPEDTWSLLVLGSSVLPLRLPGTVTLPTPPRQAWQGPEIAPRPTHTIDRRLVHRRAVAETFATGVSVGIVDDEGRRAVDCTAQLPRLHPVHSDHLGAQRGRVDLLQVMETCRQCAIASAHTEYGAPSDASFLVRSFGGGFLGACAPSVGDVPLDLTIRVTSRKEHRRSPEGPVVGLEVAFDVQDSCGNPLVRLHGAYTWLDPAGHAELRSCARSKAGLTGDPIPARRVDALPHRNVLRSDPANAVVAVAEDAPTLRLVVDTGHPVHFDHPLDHVPGMLQLEGARQAALLSIDEDRRDRMLLSAIDARFVSFAELDLPTYCEVTGVDDEGSQKTVAVRVTQAGYAVSEVTVTLTVGARP